MQPERIKSARVRKIFGDCSAATLYRLWKEYRILPPPTVIRNTNYWTLAEVERAFQNSQKADITQTANADADRAATARRGRQQKATAAATGDR